MLRSQITPGMTVRAADARGNLTTVTVRTITGRGRGLRAVVAHDDGTTDAVALARLWPAPGSILHGLETTGGQIVAPPAIPGVTINRRRRMESMAGANARGIARIVGRHHVSESPRAILRAVIAAASGRGSLRVMPPAFRRGAIHCILATIAANRAEYQRVMGHAPVPTEAQVTAAMLACR